MIIKHLVVTLLVSISLLGCTIATPFRTSDSGKDPDRLVLVALTHVVLDSDSPHKDLFWDYVFRIEGDLPKISGAIGHSIRKRLFADEGWTMSVWEDEASMNNFVRSGIHNEAVEKAGGALKLVEYARVKLPRSKIPPSWDEVERLLLEQNPKSAKSG
jgi:hypothetical protein